MALYPHFIAWCVALIVFGFFEWRHPGFVSFVFPFPVLVFAPGLILVVMALLKKWGYCGGGRRARDLDDG